MAESRHKRRFFFFEAEPLNSAFGVSLKNCILVISVLDFILGFSNAVRFIEYSLLLYMGSQSVYDVLTLISYLIASLSIIFAFNCLKAISILKWKYLRHYSIYKQVEFIVQMVIWVSYEVLQFSDGYVSYPILVYIAITRCFLFYIAYVVWSAYYHIRSGTTFIVLEGKI